MGRKRNRRSVDEFPFEEQLPYEKTQYARVKPFRAKTKAQTEAHDIVKENTLSFLGGPAGCHAKGTSVLMFDGTLKNVEDVCVGDLLMGPDSTPREVKKLVRGVDEMYRIIPSKGDSFVVNSQHVLYVASRNKNVKEFSNKKYLEISVKELINGTKYLKDSSMLVNSSEIEFEEKPLPVPPYILGIWLGDGSTNQPALTCQDNTIYDEWISWAISLNLRIRETSKPGANCKTVYTAWQKGFKNPATELLSQVGVFGNKHIPQLYKSSSIEQRLQLLAGLIDTDGYLGDNYYEYTTKLEHLAKDVQFIAKSLGFASYVRPMIKKSQNGTAGLYYKVSICGNVDKIPVKLEYKKARERKQIKNVLHRTFKIEPVGVGEYYGFTLDKDHLYLTSDFAIHHNCGKTVIPCFLALEALANNSVKKIIITRPNVEAGKSLGYLPGSAEEKLFHYLVPIYDNLEIFIGKEKLAQLLEEEVIQCVPIGFMRGRTLADSFIIIDEAQNMTREQLRMVLTRIGFGSRAVVTYDTEQIDIRKSDSCVVDIPLFEGHNSIGHFMFNPEDVVRSEIVKTVLQVYMEAQSEEEVRGSIL
jgi:phosphate starvation-inducible protein PhoH/intein/homing endonuclease